jgi:uncharacterized membrane protein
MTPRWATGRVEAFSDGVFAIAITLLVLDLKIAPGEVSHLWSALAGDWPSYLAFVTSFLTIGAVWLTHHSLFVRLRFVDPALMRLNIVLLMVVSLLPFPTALVADAIDVSRDSERAAVVVYGLVLLVIDLLIVAASRHAAMHPDLLVEGEDVSVGPSAEKRGAVRIAAYAVAIVAGVLLLPRLAAIAYLAIAVREILSARGEGRMVLRGSGATE